MRSVISDLLNLYVTPPRDRKIHNIPIQFSSGTHRNSIDSVINALPRRHLITEATNPPKRTSISLRSLIRATLKADLYYPIRHETLLQDRDKSDVCLHHRFTYNDRKQTVKIIFLFRAVVIVWKYFHIYLEKVYSG